MLAQYFKCSYALNKGAKLKKIPDTSIGIGPKGRYSSYKQPFVSKPSMHKYCSL